MSSWRERSRHWVRRSVTFGQELYVLFDVTAEAAGSQYVEQSPPERVVGTGLGT
jgi:hypothetical protein